MAAAGTAAVRDRGVAVVWWISQTGGFDAGLGSGRDVRRLRGIWV